MSRDLKKIYDLRDKEWVVRELISEMERRCQTIFKWEGLPETIDERWLELLLQRTGNITVTKINQSDIKQYTDSRDLEEGIYCFAGGLGGVEDFNGLQTFSIVAHPRLLKSLQLKIGEECVVGYNDSQHRGLWDLHLRWATQLAEALLSLQIGNVSTRALTIATVGTDTEKAAFENYMKKLESGELSALIGNLVMDSIKMQPYATTAHQMLTDIIEEAQWLKASWARDLGMDENFNLKREAIMAAEASLGEDAIMTLLEDMLNERKKLAEEMNRLYDLGVSVDFARIFANNILSETEQEAIEYEGVDTTDAETMSDTETENVDGVGSGELDDDVDENTETGTESELEEETVTEDNTEEEKQEKSEEVVINVNIGEAEEVEVSEEEVEEAEQEEETEEEDEDDETERD